MTHNTLVPMNGRLDTAQSAPNGFESVGYKVANALDLFPAFRGVRAMMMPFYAHDVDGSLAPEWDGYKPLLKAIIAKAPKHVVFPHDATAYLTVDEMHLEPGVIQRKPMLHVDGMYRGELAGAWGGGGGGWGSCGNGMLLVSNTDHLCSMWTGSFDGIPVADGDCEHLREQLDQKTRFDFQAGDVVWADGLLVHESYPARHAVDRQFVRVSLPNNAPWFVGYTENPLSIKPCGPIINERRI